MATTVTTSVPEEDLVFPIEDGDDITFTIRIPNTVTPTQLDLVDLSTTVDGLTADRYAIIRMAVKPLNGASLENSEGLFFKTSHYADQIEIFDQTTLTGQGRILIDKPDTELGVPELSYCYDIEVTRQDALRSGAQAGTIELQASPNGATIIGTGTDFTKAKKGDVLQLTDGLNESTPAIIESVTNATTMVVSFADWASVGSGKSFEIRRGRSTTAIRGAFILEEGQVKN